MDEFVKAAEGFTSNIASEIKRIEGMKQAEDFLDFATIDSCMIGVLPGDGIGPIIMKQALRVLNFLLSEELEKGAVKIRLIEGCTIENRAAKLQGVPEEVLEEIKKCHVLLKGPMVTPVAGGEWPNIPSANLTLRKELDLFANVRPIAISKKNIDWAFFRENIEGEYILGSKGIQVNEDLAIDFRVSTKQGSERIAKAAFDYAKKNKKNNVTVVTKANIVKLTDGNFIKACRKVAEDYPDIALQERFIDAMCAKLGDEEFTRGMQIFVLPNLYGDILTDVAAEMQGGLGTAGAGNLGKRYGVFEAIHGTAPYLMSHGRGDYADPCSLIRGVGMLLAHIGYSEKTLRLTQALEICTNTEKRVVVTTQKEDASAAEFTDYLLETLQKQ